MRSSMHLPARGIAIGKTTVDLLQPFCRLLDLLDASEDIPFLSNLIQREIVYRLLRGPQGERLRAIATLGDQPPMRDNHASVEPAQWWPQAAIRSRDACRHLKQPSPADGEKAPAHRLRRGPRLDAGAFCKGRQKRGKFRNVGPFRLRFPGGSC